MIDNNQLFLSKGSKYGSAGHRFCEQLVAVVRNHQEELSTHIQTARFNPYGLRKGAAMFALSATTAAPSVPAIARRGEWSIGKVLDCYWHFNAVGDQYLGRVLAGLDPNSNTFDILPPHWNIQEPMSNQFISNGMKMTYGCILEEHTSFVKVLLRCFACMIHHQQALRDHMYSVPGHEFTKLKVLQNLPLLNELSKLVTVEPTEGVISVATGIPPHVHQARVQQQLLQCVGEIKEIMLGLRVDLTEAVTKVMDNHAIESGNLNMKQISKYLEERIGMSEEKQGDLFRDGINEVLDAQAQLIKNIGGNNRSSNDDEVEVIPRPETIYVGDGGVSENIFCYDGKLFYVPQLFKFPRATVKEGLSFWFRGLIVSNDGKKKD